MAGNAVGADRFLPGTFGLALVAPGNFVGDVNDSIDGQILSGDRLDPQARSASPKDLGLGFAAPMFLFQGNKDLTTPAALARQYLGAIKAPHREFVPFDGGHFAVFMNSDQFLRELLAHVLPLAGGC